MLLVTPVPSPAVKSQNVCCEIGPGLFVSKRNRNAQFPPAGFNGSLIFTLDFDQKEDGKTRAEGLS